MHASWLEHISLYYTESKQLSQCYKALRIEDLACRRTKILDSSRRRFWALHRQYVMTAFNTECVSSQDATDLEKQISLAC